MIQHLIFGRLCCFLRNVSSMTSYKSRMECQRVHKPKASGIWLKKRVPKRTYSSARPCKSLLIQTCPGTTVEYKHPLAQSSEKRPEMGAFRARRATLRNKKNSFCHNIDTIAEMGFYFCDGPDRVRCYSCGLGLCDLGYDELLVTHVLLSPYCDHARRKVSDNDVLQELLDRSLYLRADGQISTSFREGNESNPDTEVLRFANVAVARYKSGTVYSLAFQLYCSNPKDIDEEGVLAVKRRWCGIVTQWPVGDKETDTAGHKNGHN